MVSFFRHPEQISVLLLIGHCTTLISVLRLIVSVVLSLLLKHYFLYWYAIRVNPLDLSGIYLGDRECRKQN